jgi:hypothetical protein
MDGFASSLRLGWNALFLREGAYEEMRGATNPVVKGLVLIVVIGLAIALLNLIGTGLEWASTPNLSDIQATVYRYLVKMPWYEELSREAPDFASTFKQWYDLGWRVFPTLFDAPSIGRAALGIIGVPLGLIIRWLIYGLLAYLAARLLGGSGNLSETLGLLALAVAPQMLRVITLLPFLEVGSLVRVWGILCAYLALKTAHNLSWARAVWATLLPYILALAALILTGCLGTAILGAVARGG